MMKIGSKTDKGKVREQNEDCFGYRDRLFVVADGMGGHKAGEVASALAVETLLNTRLDSDIPQVLREAVKQANQAILEVTARQPECEGMGTTIAILIIEGDRGYFTHVGDSRIYRYSGEELTQLTDDHSLVAELVKSGGITVEQAQTHPQRNVLTKALGATGVEVEVHSVPVTAGDKFLLCSDGLSGAVKDSVIRQTLAQPDEPQRIADNLIQLAWEAGGADNITVIVIEI